MGALPSPGIESSKSFSFKMRILIRLFRGYSEDIMNLPQFNGHFKKYTDEYTMRKKGVSDEKTEAVI